MPITTMKMPSVFLEGLLDLINREPDACWDLDKLADKTGYSKYHLCRAFHAATHEPLLTYLRRLRLARGAEALVNGARVLDVAIESGYQSQEAFHRAFCKMFGVTPKAMQAGALHTSQLLKQPWKRDLMPPPPLAVRQETRDAFSVYGMGGHFSYTQLSQIEALWQRFGHHVCATGPTVGVTLADQDDPEGFLYYACVPESTLTAAQTSQLNLDKIEIPRQCYQVFRHVGAANSMLQAFNYIWGVWLPKHPAFRAQGIDFEYYPPAYDPLNTNSWVDIFVPVQTA